MVKYKQYEEENRKITEYLKSVKKEFSEFLNIKEEVKASPDKYTEKVADLRVLIKDALLLARRLGARKGDQGGFNNKDIAADVKKVCYGLNTLIAHYYHPWELAERGRVRKENKRNAVVENMDPISKANIEYLYEVIDGMSSMKHECTELCERGKNNLDDNWLLDAQAFRGELEYIIKRCKLIYKAHKGNEEVAKMVHRQIVYECRVMDARIRRWTDPFTDFR